MANSTGGLAYRAQFFMEGQRMKLRFLGYSNFAIAALVFGGLTADTLAQTTQNIRIATYNIEDDINGATVPLPGFAAGLGGNW